MLVRRRTTAQSAEIQSFGVHLSMCLIVGKERAHTPRRYGAAHGRAQEPAPGSAVEFWGESVRRNRRLVPRSNIAGSWTPGGPGQCVEEQGTWAAQKHSETGYGRPVDRGVWTAKTVKRPRQQPAHPQYANYWAPLTRKRHTMPHSAQSQHANYWAPRTRKRHQQEHQPQRPTESSDRTQHAKGRTGDRPGPRKGATTRRNVTQGGVTKIPPALILALPKKRPLTLFPRW